MTLIDQIKQHIAESGSSQGKVAKEAGINAGALSALHGKVIKVSVVERVGYGVQITAQGNEKSCLVTYEAMLGMAEAMGLFDEVKEQNND